MNRLTIAVDFDGVLHKYDGWKGPEHLDEPYPWAQEFLERCNELNYEVMIHTTRDRALVEGWLAKHRLINLVSGIMNEKPPAIAYVDDRGVRFDPNDMDKVFSQIIKYPWWKCGPIPEK